MKTKKVPQTLSKEQLNLIIVYILTKKNKYGGYYFHRVRNAFMIYFSYYLGLRPKECYNSRVEHINLEEGCMYIPAENNKQRQQDFVYFPDFLIPAIKRYLEIRKRYYPNSPYMFPTKKSNGGSIDRSQYAKIFREALRGVNLYKISYIDQQNLKRANLSLYSLRHSFGTNVFKKTHDIKKTAMFLRHKDLMMRSAMIYVHCCENEIKKEIVNEIY